MYGMVIEQLGPVPQTQLRWCELPMPAVAAQQVMLKVSACGVCHTELDEIEGRTPPPRLPRVPGHQVVGRVIETGDSVTTLHVGDRVGVGWIYHSNGRDDENISDEFVATGRDVDGGYAEYMAVPAAYAYPIPPEFSDVQAAPLLCAGAIGYRSLKLTGISDGDRLGLTGFGGSAHLVLQLCRYLYPNTQVFVFARDEKTRQFARELGADWVGPTQQRTPQPLRAIIDTTPAWTPVVYALSCLQPGGRLVINAIDKTNDDVEALTQIRYQTHLWLEREIKSVANITAADIQQFLALAAQAGIAPTVTTYPLAQANRALADLKLQAVRGAKVLTMDDAG